MDEKTIKEQVQKRYATIAQGGSCCGTSPSLSTCKMPSAMTRYSESVTPVVEGAALGLGCGIPTQYAKIKVGDTVLDLGSGAGVDVFIASETVTNEGRVIGVDMTPEMIQLARSKAVEGGYRNVEFRQGDIEALPVDDNSIDVVISNCVITLVPDKRQVFAEIYRVLKKGGHFSISDIVTYGVVPEEIRRNVELWAGCVGGAMDKEDYLGIMREAGFKDVRVDQLKNYDWPENADYGFASITVEGYKP